MTVNRKTIIQLVLFLFSMNLFNLEGRILFVCFVMLLLFYAKSGIKLTVTAIILGGFCIVFYFFAAFYNPSFLTYYILPYLLSPIMGYIIGYNIVGNEKNDDKKASEKSLKALVYIILYGRFVHGLLNFSISNAYSGFNRNGLDFWTRTTLSATGQGALMTMAISLLFYGIVIVTKESMLEKCIILTCVAISVLNSILSASRTALLVMVVAFLLCTVYTVKNQSIKKDVKIKILIGIACFFVSCVVIYQINLFNIKSYWKASPLYERINTVTFYESGDVSRRSSIIDAIIVGVNNPFGDGDMNTTAHNLWLDIFRETGWIPFGLIVFFTLSVIRKLISIIRFDTSTIKIKYLLLSVVSGMLLNFCFEPIMKGMPYYFASFCIISGGLEKFYLMQSNRTMESGTIVQ